MFVYKTHVTVINHLLSYIRPADIKHCIIIECRQIIPLISGTFIL